MHCAGAAVKALLETLEDLRLCATLLPIRTWLTPLPVGALCCRVLRNRGLAEVKRDPWFMARLTPAGERYAHAHHMFNQTKPEPTC